MVGTWETATLMIPWVEWLKSVTNGQSVAEICLTIGTSRATLNRWLTLERPPCAAIIDLSVAYDADVLVGLVVSGYITRAYVEGGVEQRLQHVPAIYLTNELARRAAAEKIVPAVNPDWE